MLTKGAGIETPFGNRRGWKREGLRQQACQERGKSRCGKGVFVSSSWVFQLVVPGHRPHCLTSFSGPYKKESFKPSRHLGNRQARNAAKAAVAKGGSGRVWKAARC